MNQTSIPAGNGRISVFEPPPRETPSTKPHVPEKFQISKHQTQKTDAGANGAQVGF
jgi:hypothetical protein